MGVFVFGDRYFTDALSVSDWCVIVMEEKMKESMVLSGSLFPATNLVVFVYQPWSVFLG